MLSRMKEEGKKFRLIYLDPPYAKQKNIEVMQYIDDNDLLDEKGGTDSGNIHKTNAGVINMTLSIPIRYMHTNSSMISMEDVENCIILLTKLVEEINDEVFDQVSMK